MSAPREVETEKPLTMRKRYEILRHALEAEIWVLGQEKRLQDDAESDAARVWALGSLARAVRKRLEIAMRRVEGDDWKPEEP